MSLGAEGWGEMWTGGGKTAAGHLDPGGHPTPTEKRVACLTDHQRESRLPERGSELSRAGALRAREADPGDPSGAAAGCEQENRARGIPKDKPDL